MGTWGNGPYDNDAAADLLAFVEQAGSRGSALIAQAIRRGSEEELVAAAAMLAAGKWRDQRSLAFADGRARASRWSKRNARKAPDSLRLDATRRLKGVLRLGSRLGWTNPKNERAWLRNIQRIVERLERSGSRGKR